MHQTVCTLELMCPREIFEGHILVPPFALDANLQTSCKAIKRLLWCWNVPKILCISYLLLVIHGPLGSTTNLVEDIEFTKRMKVSLASQKITLNGNTTL